MLKFRGLRGSAGPDLACTQSVHRSGRTRSGSDPLSLPGAESVMQYKYNQGTECNANTILQSRFGVLPFACTEGSKETLRVHK